MLSPAELHQLADAVAIKVAEKLGALSAADAWLDSNQAADLLNVSLSTLERRTRSGEVPSIKTGRLRRYRRSDLLGMNEKGGAHQ